jgi:hypothetical protein
MTTEQRLDRLERENKWMRRAGVVAVAVAAAVFLMGQDKAKDLLEIEVQSLKVRAKDGRARATLGADADGSLSLAFADKNFKVRAVLATLPNGSPFLRLADKNGKMRAVLGVTPTYHKVTGGQTKTAENTLTLLDAKGKVIWQAPQD